VQWTLATRGRGYTPGILADMRKRAAEVLAKAKLGTDVQAVKKATRVRKVATVGELVKLYLRTSKRTCARRRIWNMRAISNSIGCRCTAARRRR
jgi:hypothetical protein